MRSRVGAHQSLFDKIDHIFKLSKALPVSADTPYVQAELCKYCCILASAAIDVCLEDCLLEYAEKSKDHRITAFVQDRLGRARNPTIGTICSVLHAFDHSWRQRIDQYADQKIRSDVNSIVHNRNEIAHGRNSQISFGRLIPWVATATLLCKEIEDTVFP
jgi:hypothetical protein